MIKHLMMPVWFKKIASFLKIIRMFIHRHIFSIHKTPHIGMGINISWSPYEIEDGCRYDVVYLNIKLIMFNIFFKLPIPYKIIYSWWNKYYEKNKLSKIEDHYDDGITYGIEVYYIDGCIVFKIFFFRWSMYKTLYELLLLKDKIDLYEFDPKTLLTYDFNNDLVYYYKSYRHHSIYKSKPFGLKFKFDYLQVIVFDENDNERSSSRILMNDNPQKIIDKIIKDMVSKIYVDIDRGDILNKIRRNKISNII